MKAPCPTCGREHDLTTLHTGDTILCTCDELIHVRWISGGVKLTAAGVGKPKPHKRTKRNQ